MKWQADPDGHRPKLGKHDSEGTTQSHVGYLLSNREIVNKAVLSQLKDAKE